MAHPARLEADDGTTRPDALAAQHLHTSDIDNVAIDAYIAQIDRALSAQLDAILHHPKVQALETAWRGLYAFVRQVDFQENIKVECVHVTQDELVADFDDAAELSKSGLYRLVYSGEYGVFGGQPVGAVIGHYAFGPNKTDMKLLDQIAAVCSMAHAPFITDASPHFFGTSFSDLAQLTDIPAMLEGPQMARWQRFRDSDHSRFVGLCLPRILLRLPYTQEHSRALAFNFCEGVDGAPEHYLWGHACTAFAGRLADSFARHRWCAHIVGPYSGGAVPDLVTSHFDALATLPCKIPTDILIGDRLENILSEQGFIALSFRKAQARACFLSAASTKRCAATTARVRPDATPRRANIDSELPYLFILTRLAHYIKVMQRESLGQHLSRTQVQHNLNQWLSLYVADMDEPAPNVRAKRPLRRATVALEEVVGQPEWYRCRLMVEPHLKHMGAALTLSLVGRLDAV